MDVDSHIYGPETRISEHTNKPINNVARSIFPVFWCEICQLRLKTAHTAIQHFGGRQHKGRISANNNPIKHNNQNDTSKRKHGVDSGNMKEPAAKRIKEQPAIAAKPDPNLSCEDCDLQFATVARSIQHLKGKRHASTITAKLEAKQSKTIARWQSRGPATENQRGRGRGGMGRGRGDGFSRGVGFSQDGRFGRGTAAGQLVRALQNFYDQPSSNSLSAPGYNSWINQSGNMQRNEPRSSFGAGYNDVYGNSGPSNYGTPQHLNKDRLGQSFTSSLGSQQFSHGPPKDRYGNNPQLPSMNYGSSAPPRTMNNSFSGGSGNYYSNDYWRQ